MKHNYLIQPGKLLYQSPVSEAFALHTEQFICASGDLNNTTEEWVEIDLSSLSIMTSIL